MMVRLRSPLRSGQTLVMLLVFMTVAITVTAASVALSIDNSRAASKVEVSGLAAAAAESGIENALLRLLRNPGFTGETLTVGDGTATITVTGTNPIIITSTGESGGFVRRVQVTASYAGDANMILNIDSWQEIY